MCVGMHSTYIYRCVLPMYVCPVHTYLCCTYMCICTCRLIHTLLIATFIISECHLNLVIHIMTTIVTCVLFARMLAVIDCGHV